MKTITHEQHRLAAQFLKRIRNPFKRSYGVKYWNWLCGTRKGADPEYSDISYMAAQGVRMHLCDIAAVIREPDALTRSLDEAFNTGDGSYRP